MKTAEKIPAIAERASAPAPRSGLSSSKVLPAHLERLAIVYVRQSSPRQVLENRESTARQCAFADQAVAFGWPRERVVTIDDRRQLSFRSSDN